MSPHVLFVAFSDVVDVFPAADVSPAESADHPADAAVRTSLPEERWIVLCFCICLLMGCELKDLLTLVKAFTMVPPTNKPLVEYLYKRLGENLALLSTTVWEWNGKDS